MLPSGEHRAATVTQGQGDGTGIASLIVFKAETADDVGCPNLVNGADPNSPTFLVVGVYANAVPLPGTYHWPSGYDAVDLQPPRSKSSAHTHRGRHAPPRFLLRGRTSTASAIPLSPATTGDPRRSAKSTSPASAGLCAMSRVNWRRCLQLGR